MSQQRPQYYSAVPTQPSRECPHSVLACLVDAKYPNTEQIIQLEQVIMLLLRGNEGDRQGKMPYVWSRLVAPKPGESFLYRRWNNAELQDDGHPWKPEVHKTTRQLGIFFLEFVMRVTTETAPARLARLEYRLLGPGNNLCFIHYVPLDAVRGNKTILAVSPEFAQSLSMLGRNVAAQRPPAVRPPQAGVASAQDPRQHAAVQRPMSIPAASRMVPPVRPTALPRRGPVHAPSSAQPNPLIDNEPPELAGDPQREDAVVKAALVRIQERERQFLRFLAPGPAERRADQQNAKELERLIERERAECKVLQNRLREEQERIKTLRREAARIFEKIDALAELPPSEFDAALQPWVEAAGFAGIRRTPSGAKQQP